MASKQTYEAPEMAAFVRRVMRGMVRRAAEGDLEVLSALKSIREAVDVATADSARALHDFDYSWTDIGRELGITRQAARQAFTTREADGQ